eukprot:COSAG05_NODE_1425_length_4921_cov_2.177727_4_plen_48_part_01
MSIQARRVPVAADCNRDLALPTQFTSITHALQALQALQVDRWMDVPKS